MPQKPLIYRFRVPCLFAAAITLGAKGALSATDRAELEARVAALKAELEAAEASLAALPSDSEAVASPTPAPAPPSAKITPGDLVPALEGLTIGGAVRANYYFGDYSDSSTNTSADAAGNGTTALDTFRINADYSNGPWSAKAEYRFYEGYYGNDSYHFLHTGWIGRTLANEDSVQVGLNRVPFGPGAYGISQSWFFDQHYYLGLADDMDLGVKYSGSRGAWSFDLAYYAGDEGTWSGSSRDSSRYSYDVVDESGAGYEERHQFNLRAIHHWEDGDWSVDFGASLQVGTLKSNGPQDDGEHYALSLHPTVRWNNWTLATQWTAYNYDVDAAQPLGTDQLVQLGAYDFPTTIAAEAQLLAASLSLKLDTPRLGWLDYVVPYIEYSSIIKAEDSFNNSDLFTLGAAWARGGWYIYSEMAASDGNDFVGNESGYNSRFGSNPDNDWEVRYNLNFGYYF